MGLTEPIFENRTPTTPGVASACMVNAERMVDETHASWQTLPRELASATSSYISRCDDRVPARDIGRISSPAELSVVNHKLEQSPVGARASTSWQAPRKRIIDPQRRGSLLPRKRMAGKYHRTGA